MWKECKNSERIFLLEEFPRWFWEIDLDFPHKKEKMSRNSEMPHSSAK